MARNFFSEPLKSLNQSEIFSRLPPNLVKKLMPFQREGILFAVGKNGRCLIADEMGLGKTIQAISVAYYYREEWPLLIIVPSSLRYSWIEELEKWLPDIHPQDINLIQGGNDASGISLAKVTITTFGLLSKKTSHIVLEALANQKFKVVIVDESHYIRNSKTASCKAVSPLITSADRRILLSGTPALSKPVELYPQIDALYPGKFGSWWKFTDRYCDAKIEWIGRIKRRTVDGASNLEELQSRLSNTLMIRREKCEVLKQLPPKQRQKVLFELKDSHLKKDIKKMFEEVLTVLHKSNSNIGKLLREDNSYTAEQGQNENIQVLSLIQQLYKLSGEAKIGPVREYVEMLCENCCLKFLVFAYHHSMMNGIQQSLWEKKVKFIRIDGETKPSERLHLVQQFQSDKDTRVAILSILAAGVGLTFTAAKLVVFAEMYWTPGVLVQCEDRAHRIGQTSAVPVHYLVAKDTMDEWVWSAVCRKTIVTTATLNGKKQALQAFTGDQYQIDVLSKADAWVPNNNETLDVSGFFQSQQQPDQKSILDFFPSQSTPNNSQKLKPCSTDSEKDISVNNGRNNIVMNSISESLLSTPSEKISEPVESTDDCGGKSITLHNKAGKKRERSNSSSCSMEQSFKKLKSANGSTSIIVIDSDEEKDFARVKTKEKPRKSIVKKKNLPNTQNCFENRSSLSDSITTDEKAETSENWGCEQCTFLNNSVLPYCELCETPRKLSVKPKTILGSSFSPVNLPCHNINRNSNIEAMTESQLVLDAEMQSKQRLDFDHAVDSDTLEQSLPVDKTDKITFEKDVGMDNLGYATKNNRTVDLENDNSESNLLMSDKPVRVDRDFRDSESLFSEYSDQYGPVSPSSLTISSNLSSETVDEIVMSRDSVNTTIKTKKEQHQPNHFSEDRIESALESNIDDTIFDDWDSDMDSENVVENPAADKEERVVNLDDIPVYGSFFFCCSKYTGRIYIFDKEGESLDVNFLPLDVEIGNQDGLSDLLLHPSNQKLVQKFVREWHSLTETKRRLITKQEQLFVSPLAAYEELKSGNTSSKQRYRTKIDTASAAIAKAKEVDGSVRLITHPNIAVEGQDQTAIKSPSDVVDETGRGKGVVQAVDKNGIPLCLNCFKPYTNNLLQKQTVTGQKNAWQTRFCSTGCMDSYWMKTNTEYCREKVFEAEHGVCQLCHFDAHNFYRQIRDCIDLKKRAELIAKSKYSKLKPGQKEQMTKHPVAGQFWHADHIMPVWEGGGQCDIDNLRTLCVMCHQKITAGQARKRANVRRLSAAAGASDITAFFSPS